MQTQQHFWLKALSFGGVLMLGFYFFSQPASDLQPKDSSEITETKNNVRVISKEPELYQAATTSTSRVASNSLSSKNSQPLTPELAERLAEMQQRRPNQHFVPKDVAAAIARTNTWSPTAEVPAGLPLKPEEYNDGRQFIELDSLKIETLVPGDHVNVRVEKSAKDYKVVIDKVEKHDYNSISWYGHIQGDDGQKYNVIFTRGEHLTVGGLDTPDGHYVLQGHGNNGWVASSQLLFKADTSVSDAIHPGDVDPNYAKNQQTSHNH